MAQSQPEERDSRNAKSSLVGKGGSVFLALLLALTLYPPIHELSTLTALLALY
jgi:hypothetical protein